MKNLTELIERVEKLEKDRETWGNEYEAVRLVKCENDELKRKVEFYKYENTIGILTARLSVFGGKSIVEYIASNNSESTHDYITASLARMYEGYNEEMTELKSKVERMREALKKITKCGCGHDAYVPSCGFDIAEETLREVGE
jgi:uncharacterized protein (UPF0335 family)